MELYEKYLPALSAMMQDERIMYAWDGALGEAEMQEWYERQLSDYEYGKYGVLVAMLQKNVKFAGYRAV